MWPPEPGTIAPVQTAMARLSGYERHGSADQFSTVPNPPPVGVRTMMASPESI